MDSEMKSYFKRRFEENKKKAKELNIIDGKRHCAYCCGTLKPIGTSRKNGNYYSNDWTNRSMHKSCYKKHMEEL